MDQMSNRKFKTSKIIPYAGNLGFIVYACDSTVNLDSTNATLRDREFYVRMFVNDAPTTIPGCSSDPCLYTTVRTMFEDHIDNCEIQAICGTDDGISFRAGFMMPFLIVLRSILY